MKQKMLQLMELTKAVIAKIKTQEKNELNEMQYDTQQEYEVMADLEGQLQAIEQRTAKEYQIVKKQKEEKTALNAELVKKEGSHTKLNSLNDQITEWEKNKAEMFDKYYMVSKQVEETDNVIIQNELLTGRDGKLHSLKM